MNEKNHIPPKLATKFLIRFLRHDLAEEVPGDLKEKFEQVAREKSLFRARLNYWYQVFSYLRPFAIKKIKPNHSNHSAMFRTHLKIAWRSALKQKGYAAINLFGLVTGLASFLVIMLYVNDELSYDRFHTDVNRIYRVVYDEVGPGGTKPRISSPGALKEAMLNDIPEIGQATHFYPPPWKTLLSNDTYHYYDKKFLCVDSSFFTIFSFQFVQGNAKSAFADPASVVLTESTAKKFFGNTNALGQTLTLNQNQPVKITGIIRDVPLQSHLQFDFLTSTLLVRPGWVNSWRQGQMHTYVKVKEQVNMPNVDAKIQQLVNSHYRQNLNDNIHINYFTQPLASIHLSAPRLFELTVNSSRFYIRVLQFVAYLILLIAGINYVNLATARSARRSKEIGMRKVAGAFRNSLIYQLLTESVLIAIAAGILAVGLVEVVLPFFNTIMQKDISLFAYISLPVWKFLAIAVLALGIVAGLYPAFYLSAFKPLSLFKKQNTFKGAGSINLRKVLVVSQFTLSTFLIVGMIVVQQQVKYIQSVDLGFNKEQVIVIDNFRLTPNRDRDLVVRRALEGLSAVKAVGACNEMIGLQDFSSETPMHVAGSENKQGVLWTNIGYHYLDALGLELKEGRSFSPEFETASSRDAVILNETAVRLLGVPEPVIGQKVIDPNLTPHTVIGVVKDFHFTSLHREIKPFVFGFTPNANTVAVRLSGGDTRKNITQIEATWKRFVPDLPMDFYFLDEAIDQQYRAEQNFNDIFSIMTGLSLIISCLGLFGLAAFTAEQRTKEVGIRKVMGASVKSIFKLLSIDFVKLVLIANLIAWPIAWFAMRNWLEHFAYRVDIGITTFLMTGVLVLLIAILTVSWQTLRVAVTNPVNTLKRE